ncbi:methyltransferase-like protein 25B isoform X2 [Artemia franciscana]|uniref:methyltransferase-like protein 25B isoform X2 n=1 Tax=Artemia franciscana TaxID=6661 RepID=UPI0032DB656A
MRQKQIIGMNLADNEEIIWRIQFCFRILEQYYWLINAYTLDFFSCDHWSKLPWSWQKFLPSVGPVELSRWIESGEQRRVWPLSLLCYRRLTRISSLDRKPVSNLESLEKLIGRPLSNEENATFESPSEEITSAAQQHKDLLNIFRKHVKSKKQHEIFRIGKVCTLCASATSCHNVLDIGSGVGHLARFLHYGLNFTVACLEAESEFNSSAERFDMDLKIAVENMGKTPRRPPLHVVCRLTSNTDIETLHKMTYPVFDGGFGIIGLHTCGDLVPYMLRYFAASEKIRYLVSAGCCYMKMTSDCLGTNNPGYPVSDFVGNFKGVPLEYESREVACHALEMYLKRLNDNEVEKLKIHCYRAALECILVSIDPSLKRSGLRSVKNAHCMPFNSYAMEAVKKMDINLDKKELQSVETLKRLSRWQEVYKFYTIRLMLAPVIETVILLDRLLFLKERGFRATILPLFDPVLSARNLTIVAMKL